MTLIATGTHTLVVRSASFDRMEFIPAKYTCQGQNVNPFINWSNIPDHTRSMAMIMDDANAHMANGGPFTHWIIWNIDPHQAIDENSHPGVQGKNSKGEIGYTGPCPPSGKHHYHFKVFALDTVLDLPEGSDRKSLEDAMYGHILSWGEIVGIYQQVNDPQLNVDIEPGGFR